MGRQRQGYRFRHDRTQPHAYECDPQTLQSPVAAGAGDKPAGECAANGSDEPKEHGGDIQSGELRSLGLIITIGMPEIREVSGVCRDRLTGLSS